VVPCFFSKVVVEWTPRNSGGGLVAHHAPGSPGATPTGTDPATGKPVNAEGNWLVDTAYYFVIVVKDGEAYPAIISMQSTQLKVSRTWNSEMGQVKVQGGRAPMYSSVYSLSTQTHAKSNYTWKGWVIDRKGWVSDENLYKAAKTLCEQAKAGQIRVAAPSMDDDTTETNSKQDDVPF